MRHACFKNLPLKSNINKIRFRMHSFMRFLYIQACETYDGLLLIRKSSRSAFSCLFFSFSLSRKHVICHAWKYKAHFTKPSTCLLLQHRLTISVIEMSIIGTGCMILRTILERILVLSMSVVHEVNKCFLGIVISPPLQLYFRIQSRTKKKKVWFSFKGTRHCKFRK